HLMTHSLKHITVTLATWNAVWEVYLDPKWARQWLRLYGAQDQPLEQFFRKVGGGGGGRLEEDMAKVSMERHGRAKQLVVFLGAAGIGTQRVAHRKPPQAPCSSQAATQAAAPEPGPNTPPPAKRIKAASANEPTQPTKGQGKGQDQGALPAKGKKYPGLDYKRLRDKPPKAQEQQQPAEAQ
ncbi:hypothetical protein QJQ45_024996, partial [Haematococcus lacustris]